MPREFRLLLGRAWRQASRNKLLIVSLRVGWGLLSIDAELGCLPPCPASPRQAANCPVLVASPAAFPSTNVQIVTLAQTCIIALMLAWLYSDMDQSYAGIQDETG